MKKIVIISLAVLSFLFASCEKEGVTMYVQDPTVYFSEDSIVYTFVENMDRIDIGFDTLNIPVLISGMAVDYDRKVNIEVIANDVRHTATAEMFTIGEGLVKSNEYRGYIPLQINYVPELDDSIDELISIWKMEEEVLNLLSDNPNSWTIQGKNIVFSDNNILNKYNNLVKTIETKVTKI